MGAVSSLPRPGGPGGGALSKGGAHSGRGGHKDVHLEWAGGVQESVEQPGGCGGAGEWVVSPEGKVVKNCLLPPLLLYVSGMLQ